MSQIQKNTPSDPIQQPSTVYQFHSKLWVYGAALQENNHEPIKGAWYFITLPKDISKEIKTLFSFTKRGWGSLYVQATIGKTTWDTSIFPDKKLEAYVLPIKADIRKKEALKPDQSVSLTLHVRL